MKASYKLLCRISRSCYPICMVWVYVMHQKVLLALQQFYNDALSLDRCFRNLTLIPCKSFRAFLIGMRSVWRL
jgi:hypothetical protein